jgi:hypothetical protein
MINDQQMMDVRREDFIAQYMKLEINDRKKTLCQLLVDIMDWEEQTEQERAIVQAHELIEKADWNYDHRSFLKKDGQ